MDRIMSREALSALLDQVTREITRESGVILNPAGPSRGGPGEEICTVYITFNRGMDTSLSLSADSSVFVRMARDQMQTEELTPKDVEEVAKEYFNVLCGHVLTRLFAVTRIPARFSVPAFCRGRHVMRGTVAQIILDYTGDRQEWVQLVHHTPCRVSPAVDFE